MMLTILALNTKKQYKTVILRIFFIYLNFICFAIIIFQNNKSNKFSRKIF